MHGPFCVRWWLLHGVRCRWDSRVPAYCLDRGGVCFVDFVDFVVRVSHVKVLNVRRDWKRGIEMTHGRGFELRLAMLQGAFSNEGTGLR